MCDCSKTDRRFAQLQAVIDEYKQKPGPLMPVMQKAQNIFGCVSLEVQTFIAQALDIPLSDVYGISTFYSQFTLKPKGKHTISICMGTACYVKGAQAILDEVKKQLGIEAGDTTADGLFSLEGARCLGCCGLAPVMMIDDQVYGPLKPGDIQGILKKYKE